MISEMNMNFDRETVSTLYCKNLFQKDRQQCCSINIVVQFNYY